MDIGFSRRARQRVITPLDQLNYVSLLAELAAVQAATATARAQSQINRSQPSPSQIGTAPQAAQLADNRSFHPETAALLRNGKE